MQLEVQKRRKHLITEQCTNILDNVCKVQILLIGFFIVFRWQAALQKQKSDGACCTEVLLPSSVAKKKLPKSNVSFKK